jgi:hypothetical protein
VPITDQPTAAAARLAVAETNAAIPVEVRHAEVACPCAHAATTPAQPAVLTVSTVTRAFAAAPTTRAPSMPGRRSFNHWLAMIRFIWVAR